jgi:hypothetical protein
MSNVGTVFARSLRLVAFASASMTIVTAAQCAPKTVSHLHAHSKPAAKPKAVAPTPPDFNFDATNVAGILIAPGASGLTLTVIGSSQTRTIALDPNTLTIASAPGNLWHLTDASNHSYTIADRNFNYLTVVNCSDGQFATMGTAFNASAPGHSVLFYNNPGMKLTMTLATPAGGNTNNLSTFFPCIITAVCTDTGFHSATWRQPVVTAQLYPVAPAPAPALAPAVPPVTSPAAPTP